MNPAVADGRRLYKQVSRSKCVTGKGNESYRYEDSFLHLQFFRSPSEYAKGQGHNTRHSHKTRLKDLQKEFKVNVRTKREKKWGGGGGKPWRRKAHSGASLKEAGHFLMQHFQHSCKQTHM